MTRAHATNLSSGSRSADERGVGIDLNSRASRQQPEVVKFVQPAGLQGQAALCEPDLHDGLVLNIAPLHELVP
jgi:hypothetical protein